MSFSLKKASGGDTRGYRALLRPKGLIEELMVTREGNRLKVIMYNPFLRDLGSLYVDEKCPCEGCHIWREIMRVLKKVKK